MNYIILNNKKSTEIKGLMICNLPPITKPKKRVIQEEIDGRDGDIITELGYSAYDKEFDIGLTYNYDVDEVISYFNSKGLVTFSNEPNKYYVYEIIEQIDFERLIRFKTAKVKMHVQPFKYLVNEEPIIFDENNNIQTATGEYITLNNIIKENKICSLKIKGKSMQKTRSGKNLFAGGESCENNGINFTKNEDGSYNIKGTSTAEANNYNYVLIGNSGIINGKTYTISTNQVLPSGIHILIEVYNGNTWLRHLLGTTIIPTTGVANINNGTRIRFTLRIDKNVIVNINDLKIQLEEGSTATEYEQYGVSPSPDYPSKIKSIPSVENLFYIEPQTSNGVTLSYDSDGAIVLNGKSTSGYVAIRTPIVLDTMNTTLSIRTENTHNNLYVSTRNADSVLVKQANLSKSTRFSISTNNKLETTLEIAIDSQNVVFDNYKIYAQLKKGSTAHPYVPYGNYLRIDNVGKNLVNVQPYTTKETGYTIHYISMDFIYQLEKGGKYLLQGKCSDGTLLTNQTSSFVIMNNNKQLLNWSVSSTVKTLNVDLSGATSCYIYTNSDLAGKEVIEFQLEKAIGENPTPTEYEPYRSNITNINMEDKKLCSIGDVEDELIIDSMGKVKIKKYIDEIVLDGSEDWGGDTVATNSYRYYIRLANASQSDTTHNLAYCSHFTLLPQGGTTTNIGFTIINSTLYIRLSLTGNDLADFKTWLKEQYDNGTPVKVQYVLATPEEFELEPTETITLFEGTNNLSNSENASMTIVYENDELSVLNGGNYISKSIINIYGNGTINLYLNGYQLFVIELGEEEFITLDIANMEAYKNGTLKNRLVNGNYDNFNLNVGENKISWTGNITKLEVSKYSRWL